MRPVVAVGTFAAVVAVVVDGGIVVEEALVAVELVEVLSYPRNLCAEELAPLLEVRRQSPARSRSTWTPTVHGSRTSLVVGQV